MFWCGLTRLKKTRLEAVLLALYYYMFLVVIKLFYVIFPTFRIYISFSRLNFFYCYDEPLLEKANVRMMWNFRLSL